MTSELKVYFYACYDEADKQAYSGLTIGLCAASVREDVRKNFRHPKYIGVHRVPELAVAVDGDGREYIIPQKKAPQDAGPMNIKNGCRPSCSLTV